RGLRPGAMFADWELIGVPHRLVVSDRGLAAQTLEYQHRRDQAATSVARGEVLQLLRSRSRR
ncbi:MAG: proline--tRNA ligase, partial [Betaproteobacteria bacterium]|nr:proline--tRNA ligase [Betaproteobacteria bacterium]